MKQLQFLPKANFRKEHGGTLLVGKRRAKRPLSTKTPLHLVLRSDFATGARSLLRHRPLIQRVVSKAQKRFHIKVYETAIVSNHIHILVKGSSRTNLQNFFRVVAGHIAQEILRQFPIVRCEIIQRGGAASTSKASNSISTPPKVIKNRENENKFWHTRIYSRIVSWGRDYLNVKKYVLQNTLEGLELVPYKKRKSTKANNPKIKNTS